MDLWSFLVGAFGETPHAILISPDRAQKRRCMLSRLSRGTLGAFAGEAGTLGVPHFCNCRFCAISGRELNVFVEAPGDADEGAWTIAVGEWDCVTTRADLVADLAFALEHGRVPPGRMTLREWSRRR